MRIDKRGLRIDEMLENEDSIPDNDYTYRTDSMWVDPQWLFRPPRNEPPSRWVEGRGGVATEEEGLAVDIMARGLASHRENRGGRGRGGGMSI